MIRAAFRRGAEVAGAWSRREDGGGLAAGQAPQKLGAVSADPAALAGPISPVKPPPSGNRKRRGSVVGASVLAVASKRQRRATAVGGRKKVQFSDLAVACVPSGALANAPHPAERILASPAASAAIDTDTVALRCAVIRCCLAAAVHPGDSSGAFGQRCMPADPVYLDMICSPASYEAGYADMSLVSVLTHALADAFLSFSEEAARRCVNSAADAPCVPSLLFSAKHSN